MVLLVSSFCVYSYILICYVEFDILFVDTRHLCCYSWSIFLFIQYAIYKWLSNSTLFYKSFCCWLDITKFLYSRFTIWTYGYLIAIVIRKLCQGACTCTRCNVTYSPKHSAQHVFSFCKIFIHFFEQTTTQPGSSPNIW